MLFVQELNRFEPKAIAGTEGAHDPFFSPDGEWVGFILNDALHRVSLESGVMLPIVEDIAIFEISKARGDLYQIESKLIEQVVALEVAKVDLRKTQGLLALECGFDPKLCCDGCRARGRAGSLR